MKKINLIPFWLNSKFYNLTGKEREIAKIEYSYKDGIEKDHLLCEKIYAADSIEYKKEKLNIDKKYKVISDTEYDMALATLEQRPYVIALHIGYVTDIDGSKKLSFEFDWNEFFIKDLKNQGYPGYTEDELVNNWFIDTCGQISGNDYMFGEM